MDRGLVGKRRGGEGDRKASAGKIQTPEVAHRWSSTYS